MVETLGLAGSSLHSRHRRQLLPFTPTPDSRLSLSLFPCHPTIKRDVMSHSFGEGYASRSDEEGFGGTTCEASDAASKIEQDRMIHENHPAYDKSQGSEVAEKEKARHQTTADS
ncbi:uncharacterized protein LOC114315155 isoform X2 [Camellia sinensis]|uniref:uncharacterized protein LOC114315155 isoform X2 n=1 Tax=Camellia sinensis TaxID=4442 RepID=UPI0010360F61|nr:uncharacterized protein LOC114315155 isoform X2 [Camellia sinensis]